MKEEKYRGLPASKGIAIGKPFIYLSQAPSVQYASPDGVDAEKEVKEYAQAVENSKKELTKIFKLAKEKLDDRNLLIFEAQILFLEDEILHKEVVQRIRKEHKTAATAFTEEIRKIENKLISSNDEYLKERINDVEDIKNRVLKRLINEKLFSKIDQNSIVIARNLTPGDTILFSNRNLLGFATDMGAASSHVSIIARSLSLPAVVGLNDISLNIKPSDYVIVDGYRGEVIRNPARKTISKYKKQIRKIYRLEEKLAEIEKLPTVTRDGQQVKLSVNLEFNKEIDYIVAHAKCEIGLYRTEHMFLELGDFPSLSYQYQQYKMLAERIYPSKVTIRTFDIGGDKLLPDTQKENNPFLGWRGIRIFLEKQDIFLNQLKAILRASVKGNLRIMVPMVASMEEIRKVKQLLNKAKSELRKKKIRFDENIEFGIMMEVPSAILLADAFAKEVDFFSIGTNDLIQYLLAVDRDSTIVSNLYQQFHPAVINAVNSVIKSAARNKINLNVCGEMAGDSLAAPLLIGLGVLDLSVETTAFLRIKRIIRLLDYGYAKKIAKKALTMQTSDEVKNFVRHAYGKIIQEI